MDARKTNALQHETRNLDSFRHEAPIDDRAGERRPASETTDAFRIEATNAANWLEMFDSERDHVESTGSVSRVDAVSRVDTVSRVDAVKRIAVQRTWPATRPRAAIMRLIERCAWPQADRWRANVGVIATMSAFVLAAGVLFSRVDVSIVQDDVAARPATAPAQLTVPSSGEVPPPAEPVPSKRQSARGAAARVSTPRARITAQAPRKVQQPLPPRTPARNIVANGATPIRTGTIANTPPAASPSREAALSPVIEREPTPQPVASPAPLVAAIAPTAVAPASSASPITTGAAPAVAANVPPAIATDTRAVSAALNRYEQAFSAMDVARARAVWPSVDVKALTKAFEQLEEQRFDLDDCDITVAGAQAEANCSGDARYVRKVGSKAMRVEPRRWHFKLRQANEEWIIDAVSSR